MPPLCHGRERQSKPRAPLLTNRSYIGHALRRERCSRIGSLLRRVALMALHVIVGAGPVGPPPARLLAERGDRVRVVPRRGTGPAHPAIERIAADAADADRLTALTEGAVALHNCANPAYHRWPLDWPPLAAALLTAAER